MAYETITARRLSPHVGAEISGIDLTATLRNQQVHDLHDALIDHGVIFFRKQHLDLDKLKTLGRHFGKLHFHTGVKRMSEHPEITEVYSDENSKHVNGEVWHSDLSCDAIPPLGSILHMKIIPVDGGGDTLFSSAYAAYDALSPRMKIYLEGLTATHDGALAFRRYNPDGKYPVASHPVISKHSVTGRKLIYINRGFTSHINEVSPEESAAILGHLFDHVERPEFGMRFRWDENSVAFWDNRSVQHLAIWDYFPQIRSGFRVQIAAESPIE
jgi:taurine dioxygenase